MSELARVELIAKAPSTLVGLGIIDVHDAPEEAPRALTALAERLAGLLPSESR